MDAENRREQVQAALHEGLPLYARWGENGPLYEVRYDSRRRGDHKPFLVVTPGGRRLRFRYAEVTIGAARETGVEFDAAPETDTVPLPREVYDAMLVVAKHFMNELS